MRIVIAGGTGFLGRPLARALSDDGHAVTILSRGQTSQVRAGSENTSTVPWTPDGTAGAWASAVDGAGAVVNLAGESIAGRRWSPAHKQRIVDSRVLATRSLVSAIAAARTPPPVLVSGSAVGYYGPLGQEIVTEDQPAGSDFLASVAQAWEAEARTAAPYLRVVTIRTGLALERDGGALQKMLLPFRLGVGGPIGSGRQYWPWIHRRDWIGLVRWSISTSAVEGPVNATAPNPVQNVVFSKALGAALRRPALLPTPGFALRMALGEMADALLLSGQRAVPAKAERLGFAFTYAQLPEALSAIFK
jgi:uncharacterized protein (TIGR01777 family)